MRVMQSGDGYLEEKQMHKKNFLIVTASIGSGHVKAAEAVAHEIKTKYADASKIGRAHV